MDKEVNIWKALGVFVIAMVFAIGGHFNGRASVLDAERLKAQNEAQFQIVRVTSEGPSSSVLTAGQLVCSGASSKSKCIKDYMQQFGQVWVVNLVTGERHRLSDTEE